MNVDIAAGIALAISHARDDAPNESVGFLLRFPDGDTAVYRAVSNVSPDPRHNFEVDPSQVYDLARSSFEIFAIVHSHPRGPAAPSPTDIEFFPGALTSRGFVVTPDGEVASYTADG